MRCQIININVNATNTTTNYYYYYYDLNEICDLTASLRSLKFQMF